MRPSASSGPSALTDTSSRSGALSADVQDQDYVILKDGTIATVHGWYHPAGHVVAELAFVRDARGSLELSAGRYRKAYLRDGLAVPDIERLRIRDVEDPHLFGYTQVKSVLATDRIERVVRCADWPVDESAKATLHADYIRETWRSTKDLLGADIEELEPCLTGSLVLQSALPPTHPPNGSPVTADPHDLDVIFTGSVRVLDELLDRMSAVTLKQPERRLFEHGKGWQIRLKTDRGVLCSFFRYKDAAEVPSPLSNIVLLKPGFVAECEITDSSHGLFTPSYLRAHVTSPSHLGDRTLLIAISHLRSRGDFRRGSTGVFRGDLLEAKSSEGESVLLLSVFDGDSSLSLKPPWEPYWATRPDTPL